MKSRPASPAKPAGRKKSKRSQVASDRATAGRPVRVGTRKDQRTAQSPAGSAAGALESLNAFHGRARREVAALLTAQNDSVKASGARTMAEYKKASAAAAKALAEFNRVAMEQAAVALQATMTRIVASGRAGVPSIRIYGGDR